MICDDHGGVVTCGERECSIQRRHQKLIEETPSPALDAELREEMEAATERACRHLGYRNAGTFEYLVGPDGSFSFIEINTRLQVEHPVTEAVTGLDLVRLQVLVAAGEPLPLTGRAPRRGHAIEIRINAEDPARGFAPTPGLIERFRPPLGPGVRVDTFVEDGTVISPNYDSLIAKVIVLDETREAALARAHRALSELEVARRADDPRGGARDPRERGVPERPLLDLLPRGGRRAAAGAGRLMSRVLVAEPGGSVRVSEVALAEIVRRAVESVDGARLRKGRRRLGVELEDGRARAELQLAVGYGRVLPETAAAVQERVADALARMCEVEVEAVDVTVEALERVE